MPAGVAHLDLRVALLHDRADGSSHTRRSRASRRAAATGHGAATAGRDRHGRRAVPGRPHLDQYRHATRSPEPYWREGVRREPGDSRANTALGEWHLRRGELAEAERHLRRAIASSPCATQTPRDGEAGYLLGVMLRQGRPTRRGRRGVRQGSWNGGSPAAAANGPRDRAVAARGDLAGPSSSWSVPSPSSPTPALALALRAALCAVRVTGSVRLRSSMRCSPRTRWTSGPSMNGAARGHGRDAARWRKQPRHRPRRSSRRPP